MDVSLKVERWKKPFSGQVCLKVDKQFIPPINGVGFLARFLAKEAFAV